MDLSFECTDPIQEVAAEPATLDELVNVLRERAAKPSPVHEYLPVTLTCGWPLVYDDTIPPGQVHCRPTPGAAPPPSAAEIEEYWRALAPTEGHRRPIEIGLDGIRHALTGVQFTSEDLEPAFVWPRQSGKSAFTIEATFQQTDAMKSLFAWVDAHVRARQQATVARLADELGWSEPLVRRQFDAVQDVLEAAGIGDGYGGLTIPQPVRPPVPTPSR